MSLSESRFNMWRAVVAMVHADEIVQPHEINFILENTKTLPLSKEQFEILTEDLRTPADIESHFRKITLPRDKEDFFHLARAIAWSDGEFDETEKAMLHRIRALPMAPQDTAIMEKAIGNFRDIYIEGETPRGDQSIGSFIRGLIRAKAA
jgi:uncharacterized membrane protein YebE (DUF533 family)